ncbi:hypothetical protein PV325_003342 [Microctonus aethiopoides]|uniref:Mitochondrial ribosomal protein S18C n=1 Tax=Microctonus aethiopoides TaxID=144406 RepID=A0AA39FQY6_9HYME|nr:hypothetical protein PV325_003342 [Microctonus aethiopoides]KAK0096089.1 hypothetical protein PV326_006503 [Microctonus aethiopoides]KAK0173896.1 hypothetical protein PV328_007034 [Microctonus aethiopoides]
MASLIRTLYKCSRNSLRSSYRTISNTANHQQTTSIDQKSSTNDDIPITLESNPFEKKKEKCILCKLDIVPDYKNVRLLSQFQSSYTGRIYGRHITGLCKAKQERVEREILKAQNCGFMPVYHKNPNYLRDPKLFDPDHPFRPHKY